MKTSSRILLGAFLAAALLVVVHIAGAAGGAIGGVDLSGERATRTFDLVALRHLRLDGPFRLILSAGLPSVTIEGDRALVDRLEDRDPADDVLDLRSARAKTPPLDREAGVLVARVSSPGLARVELAGNTEMLSEGALPYRMLDLDMAGSTRLDLDFADLGQLDLDHAGSLRGSLRGRADHFTFDASGSSDLDASDLITQRAEVSVSGSSSVRVHADSLLTVRGSGSTRVAYSGAARVSQRISGSGEVTTLN